MDCDISWDVLNASIDKYLSFINEKINNCYCDVIFPRYQKLQKFLQYIRKKNRLDKENYRLARVLAHLSYAG